MLCFCASLTPLAFRSDGKRKSLRKLQKLQKISSYIDGLEARVAELGAGVDRMGVEGDGDSAASTSAYYHFDSKGNKFKNKWEAYDVEAELKKVDDEGTQTKQPPQQAASSSALLKQLCGVESEIEAVLTYIDRVQSEGDAEIKAQRKPLAVRAQGLLPKVDRLKRRCV